MANLNHSSTTRTLALDRLNISANHAGIMARELLSRGVAVEPLFADLGMDLPQANRPAKRMSVEAFIKLLKLAIRTTEDPTIAFRAFQNVNPSDLDALGFAISCSSTYLDLLERFQRFSKYVMSDGIIQIIEEPDGYLFLVDLDDHRTPDLKGDSHQIANAGSRLSRYALEYQDLLLLLEAFGVGLISLSNSICAEKVIPKKVYFPSSSHPSIRRLMEASYPTTDFVSAHFFGLKISREFAEKKIPSSNPEMARINEEIILKHIKEVFENDLVLKVESAIMDGLAKGDICLSKVAAKIGKSERNLRRELSDRNTSFSDILVRVRKNLAMQYVKENKLRINQIADALGFASASNFTRSFKSWTGYTPRQFKDL